MATRKRTTRRATRRSGLVGRAVSAGRRALREAENRVPTSLRRQVERRLKDADKTARAAIKELQSQVKKASTRADVNSVLKRIDGLTKQARQAAKGGARKTSSARRRAASTTRSAASRTKKAASTTRRRAASSTRRTTPRRAASSRTSRRAASAGPAETATTTRRAAPRRRTSTRRSTPAPSMTEATSVPMMPEGGFGEMGGSSET